MSEPLGASQKAAAFLLALGEEHATRVLSEMQTQEQRALTEEILGFRRVPEVAVKEVLAEFLEGLETRDLPSYVTLDDAVEVARALVRGNTSAVVERLRGLWLQVEPESDFTPLDDESLVELDYGDLGPPQRAAVFMMWLPPELSAMVLQRLPSRLVHVVTGILVELPFVTPAAREKVLAEFMEGVTLGIPGLSVGDVGLPVVVEAFVRSNPAEVAERLEALWLEGASLVNPGLSETKSVSKELSSLEKTAVFFQSLSLPLAYKLLGILEQDEVQVVLRAVEGLGAVDAVTRKEVLQELMLASRPELRNEPQPIEVLGKAMGRMIRVKPEAVVNQLRKQWLGSGGS
jgi:flagellar motor switch protein FliG